MSNVDHKLQSTKNLENIGGTRPFTENNSRRALRRMSHSKSLNKHLVYEQN